MEAVALEVRRELTRTADAGHQLDLVGVLVEFGKRLFQSLEDAEVAASRTPRRLRFELRRVVVGLYFAFFADCAECTH